MFGLRKRVKDLEKAVERLQTDVREDHYSICRRQFEIGEVAKAAGLVWKEASPGKWEKKNETA